MSLRDKFIIEKSDKKAEPYYELEVKMHSNDGNYIYKAVTFNKTEWEKLPEFFFLMLAYLGHGYCGKFSHGDNWGDYYGHHWEDNKHGLREEIDIFADQWNCMCYSDWGCCHSFSNMTLKYYDEDNCAHDVVIPSIDDQFKTEEEMIKAIKDACTEYNIDED
jgi:hypothetical protein